MKIENDEKRNVFVFRTSISSDEEMIRVKGLLEPVKSIVSWSVDLEDSDKVLRIEAEGLKAEYISGIIKNMGMQCEELPD